MLDEDGHVVLTDFGISKAVQGTTQITSTGTIIGTPQYMSPEQAKGRNVDGRTDQYALGIVGYRALTGKVPFEGDAQSILYQQVHEPPPSLLERRPDTPPDLRIAIERALAKDPKARFPNMEEFAAWVSGERASSLDSSTITAVQAPVTQVRAPARTRQLASPESQGPGVYVALGTVAVILTAAFIGIPKLRTPVDPPPAVASTPKVQRSPAAAPRRATGSLQIRSTPRAVLYLDGVKVGLTPVTKSRVAAGSYRVRLEQRGYRPVTATLMVKAGRPTSRSFQLQRQASR
jgi:serine/threonine-protein kinase